MLRLFVTRCWAVRSDRVLGSLIIGVGVTVNQRGQVA